MVGTPLDLDFFQRRVRVEQRRKPRTALFTKPPVSRLTVVLNQNMRLRMRVHAKRTEPADAKSQCRRQRSRTRSLVRKKAAVQNDLLGSFCTVALHHSLFLLDGFRT